MSTLDAPLPVPVDDDATRNAKSIRARIARRQRSLKAIAMIEQSHNIGVLLPSNKMRTAKLDKAERKKVEAALALGVRVHRIVLEYHGIAQE